MTTIRRAGSDDVAAIRDLVRRAYAKWGPLIGREPKPMQANYDRAVTQHCLDLLCDGRRLLGVIELIPEADCLLIENVAVDPEAQGHGYGRLLMRHAEAEARSSRLGRVRLYTNQRFAANIAFYCRLGFAIDREETWPTGIVVHMSKAV